MPTFEPREGGVKIVFDVMESVADDVAQTVRGAGFDVRRYYQPEDEHGPGGSAPGYQRLGAERPMRTFTEAEQATIVAAFDDTQAQTGFTCSRVGVDVWTAGDHAGPAGVHEPRRPKPVADNGRALAAVPEE